ncbi:MAG: hypothetical protein L3K13_03315 [Thermoplasmata archaeon]|nr:hypothetical protein [Thermoplasmata archaeon]
MTLALWEGMRAEGVSRRGNLRRASGPTYRRALEERLRRWDAFGSLLPTTTERAAFARLTRGARRYVEEATYVGSPDLLESILLSVLLDLARRLPPEPDRSRVARRPPNRVRHENLPSARAKRQGHSPPAAGHSLRLSTLSGSTGGATPLPVRPPPPLEATP